MSSLETWPLELADFALVSKDGKVLSCHKARLVEDSEYFRAMLSHKMRETSSNKMDVPEYDGVTVASFLEWIYAQKFGEEVMKKLRESALPGEFIAQKQFNAKKFSPDLLKMAHLYQLKDLHDNCEEYLQRSVTKENAVETWKAAGVSGSKKLRHKALRTIARSYTTGKASDIPGLEDNVACLEEMKEWIIDHAIIIVEEEEATPDPYHVKVEFEDVRLGHETMTFNATPGEKVSSLKARVATQLGLYSSKILLHFNGNVPTGDRTTLRDWGVGSGDTLAIQVPTPLPTHVKVRLGLNFFDLANSKLNGGDTMIFIVDPSFETFESLKQKVLARLGIDPSRLRLTRGDKSIRPYAGGVWMCGGSTWSSDATLASIGIQNGDCAFECHK